MSLRSSLRSRWESSQVRSQSGGTNREEVREQPSTEGGQWWGESTPSPPHASSHRQIERIQKKSGVRATCFSMPFTIPTQTPLYNSQYHTYSCSFRLHHATTGERDGWTFALTSLHPLKKFLGFVCFKSLFAYFFLSKFLRVCSSPEFFSILPQKLLLCFILPQNCLICSILPQIFLVSTKLLREIFYLAKFSFYMLLFGPKFSCEQTNFLQINKRFAILMIEDVFEDHLRSSSKTFKVVETRRRLFDDCSGNEATKLKVIRRIKV